jgi:Leucine-rich repeat (LRR) protein
MRLPYIYSKLILLIFVLLACLFSVSLYSQEKALTAAQIRQQMAKVRQSTNWDDPTAAKKANEQIRELAKKLMMSGNQQANRQQNQANPEDEQAKQDVADEKMKLVEQIVKSASGGEGADVLLAEPIREEIKDEYQEDESPQKINQQFLQNMSLLVIDMSSPTVQYTIDLMRNYQSIKTLVITGGRNGAMVDLPDLLDRASAYPLEQLYITNFRNYLTAIPQQIGTFKNLNTLALFNNRLNQLPASLGSLSGLDSLFVDLNPIATLGPGISNLKALKKLGIAQTSIPETEVTKIKQLFPNCQIQQK